jgi:hypothetical protein
MVLQFFWAMLVLMVPSAAAQIRREVDRRDRNKDTSRLERSSRAAEINTGPWTTSVRCLSSRFAAIALVAFGALTFVTWPVASAERNLKPIADFVTGPTSRNIDYEKDTILTNLGLRVSPNGDKLHTRGKSYENKNLGILYGFAVVNGSKEILVFKEEKQKKFLIVWRASMDGKIVATVSSDYHNAPPKVLRDPNDRFASSFEETVDFFFRRVADAERAK